MLGGVTAARTPGEPQEISHPSTTMTPSVRADLRSSFSAPVQQGAPTGDGRPAEHGFGGVAAMSAARVRHRLAAVGVVRGGLICGGLIWGGLIWGGLTGTGSSCAVMSP